MRLRKIKLSGFKSFVDPTTLLVPGNLVGIVGPNGCGKSNIIDAVTWVMGESSAKQLRGESLTDVIFNGSTSRQPVGQASVELVFDNSEGRVGGQYASYNEIEIKRQITREGISSYFLNGTRCRRKDIHSIFLGTGLGPRSYSIIEQGMISRFIEAKPEELRSFIEEAAGISKYRERRRETENRILHTRDNLSRLNDIRDELDKQLNHLQRQARAAERYQTLKQEERQLGSELLALNWRGLRNQDEQKSAVTRQHETRVEQALAALRQQEAEIERSRDELANAGEGHNAAQLEFYEIGGDISQLEQKLQHTKERLETLDADLEAAGRARTEAESQQRQDQARLQELADGAKDLEPQLKGSRTESSAAYDTLNQTEQALQGWQSEWDAINRDCAELVRRLQVEEARLEHCNDGIAETRARRQTLEKEIEELSGDGSDLPVAKLAADCERLTSEVSARLRAMETRQQALKKLRDESTWQAAELTAARDRNQTLNTELASLRAIQQADLRIESGPFKEWIQSTGLADAPRLIDEIEVDGGWTLAVETVLGDRLQYFTVPRKPEILASLKNLDQCRFGLMAAESSRAPGNSRGRLADKVSSQHPLPGLLYQVHTAGNLDEALVLLKSLDADESVVTRDGIWLTHDWIRINKPPRDEQGMLAGAQRIQELEESLASESQSIARIESTQAELRNSIEGAEEELLEMQRAIQTLQDELGAARSGHAEARARLQAMERRRSQITDELEALESAEQEDSHEVESIKRRMEQATQEQAELELQRERLNSVRGQHQEALESARTRWQDTHEHSHEIALRLESVSSQRASLEQAVERNRILISNLNTRISELEDARREAQRPLADMQTALKARLDDKLTAEKKLAATREQVQSLDAAVREKEQKRGEQESTIEVLRGELEAARLAAQEIRVRLQTVREQLHEGGHEPESLLEGIDEDADPAQWKEKLEGVERRIQRLGPINLAAIDEYKQLSERKTYLDDQHRDLTEALNTLENAIQKIDRESRTRFRETFDRLNNNLKEMFPILFGGGHAYLEMTGEDLLETGVTVMARPPGKRNSNIHLLSGGEKALTAVAVVFSIFKLNPAPFCILDEVDAPLDDTNVGRFSAMVSEMAKDVQFIVITHNKITMEIAEQLLGVTMQEAGVSRLVSVDMDEAIQMAATA